MARLLCQSGGIIGLAPWLKTPPGRYLLAWEQAQLDRCVADVFGYHALQLGLPELDALRANRMPHRWLAMRCARRCRRRRRRAGWRQRTGDAAVLLHCDFDALPFDSHSLDLVVLPHSLELARDPHLTLREVERVLVPEGRVVIFGFNPASLWGLRQRLGRTCAAVALGGARRAVPAARRRVHRLLAAARLAAAAELRGRRRALRLLPAAATRRQRWLDRFDWMERAGERWWPVFGAVYFLVAVKRVRGMRLVGLVRSSEAPKRARGASRGQPTPCS